MSLAEALDELFHVAAKVAQAARKDDITCLGNTLALNEDIERSNSRLGEMDYYIFGDLNGFKAINDTLSHSAGDAVIAYTGRRIDHICKKWSARGYRKSGDEFVVLVSDKGIDGLLADLQQEFHCCRISISDRTVTFSASFGVARLGEDDVSVIGERAEAACKQAKLSGASSVVCHWAEGIDIDTCERRTRCERCGTSSKHKIPLGHSVPEDIRLACPICLYMEGVESSGILRSETRLTKILKRFRQPE